MISFSSIRTAIFLSISFALMQNFQHVSPKNNFMLPTNLQVSLESFFNFSYNSRLIYQLRTQLTSVDHQISRRCLAVLQSLWSASMQNKWSISMLDANAPMLSLFTDQLVSLGSYEQCLSIYESQRNTSSLIESFSGQYCLLKFVANNNLNLNLTDQSNEMKNLFEHLQHREKRLSSIVLGICFPSICSTEEMQHLVQAYLRNQSLAPLFRSKIEHCQNAKNVLSFQDSFFEIIQNQNLFISILILSVAFCMSLIGTFVHIFGAELQYQQYEKRSITISILTSFSIIKNIWILFGRRSTNSNLKNLTTPSIEQRVDYLHGVRVLMIFWIIIAHSCSFIPASIVMPIALLDRFPHDLQQMVQNNGFLGNFLNNGTLAVEAFFLVSGLLLIAISVSKKLLNKINFLIFVSLRWLRFAPPLLGMIVIQKCVVLFGNGPLFNKSILEQSIYKDCHDSQWWKSFLFVSNWNISNTCLPISWFISVDFQIHFLAFPLFVLLRRKLTKAFHVYCAFMIVISLGVPMMLLLSGQIETFANLDLFSNYKAISQWNYALLYSGTHIHMAAYFFGSILGLVLARNKRFFAQQPWIETLAWYVSLVIVLVTPFIRTPPLSENVGHIRKSLNIGALHAIWITCLSVLFYLLTSTQINDKNRGNDSKHILPWKKFLSSSAFRPLSRLSFCMYLSHMTPIWFNLFNVRSPFEVNLINVTMFTFAILGETLLVSLILFLLFECPSVNLLKLIFNVNRYGNYDSKNNNNIVNENN